MPRDEEMLPILRKSGKDIILVVNKVDNDDLKEGINEFFAFGIEDVYPVSAIHNIGILSLLIVVVMKTSPTLESSVSAT